MQKNLSILGAAALIFSFNAIANDKKLADLNEKLEVLASEVQSLKVQRNFGEIDDNNTSGLGPSASKVYSLTKGLSIGGYGEVVYKNKRSDDQKNNKVSHARNPEVDTLRAVLYVGYKFNKNWVLNTEIELEHSDESFVEFLTLDYLYSDLLNFRAGLLLAPVGFVNEQHEPTTFMSVNRADIESKIIPTTWRENGMGVFGKKDKFSYRFYLMNGLNAKNGTNNIGSDGVRAGRKKGSQAEARRLAWVGRADYQLIPELSIGGSAYMGKMGGVQTNVKHEVFEGHFEGKCGGLRYRTLYVLSRISNTFRLNNELNLTGSNAVGKKMSGYYTELGYNVFHGKKDWELIPHLRWENYNTQEEVVANFTKDKARDRTNLTLGVAVRPMSNIIFKADYIIAKNKAKTANDQWNLGLGYNF